MVRLGQQWRAFPSTRPRFSDFISFSASGDACFLQTPLHGLVLAWPRRFRLPLLKFHSSTSLRLDTTVGGRLSRICIAGRRTLSSSPPQQNAQEAVSAYPEAQDDEQQLQEPQEPLRPRSPVRSANAKLTSSMKAEIDPRPLAMMIETLKEARKLGLPDAAQTYPLAQPTFEMGSPQPPSPHLESLSQRLQVQWSEKNREPCAEYQRRLDERKTLPVMAEDVQREILEKLRENDVLVIRANTASGKTTQIPQIILDDALSQGSGALCHIAISQPRRISATSVARRVAKERHEPLGQSVGYLVRFESVIPRRRGSLLYCTAGVLLKRLQSQHDALTAFSHIIIDEVHERSIITDCTLALLRDLICMRKSDGLPYPKVLLMSATISSSGFADYLTGSRYGVELKSVTMDIGGSLFPVKAQYLQDFLPALEAKCKRDGEFQKLFSLTRKDRPTGTYIQHELGFSAAIAAKRKTSIIDRTDQTLRDEAGQEGDNNEDESEALISDSTEESGAPVSPIGLLAATIFHVLEESTTGDILVFLVGWNDIERTAELLSSYPVIKEKLESSNELRIFKLHSSLTDTNDRVFDEVPAGCRRIVLSTNIAETSITLPDVEHVIDSGKIRQRYFNGQSGLDTFPARWISKSNRKQREGRAGRVKPGNYYALFTRERAESFEESTPAEITRVDLTETSLDLKASPITNNVRAFFRNTPTPPKSAAVEHALDYLYRLGAVTVDERITPLGKLLARTPVHPSMMKAALLGILFQCLEPMLTIACLELDSPMFMSNSGGGNRVPASRKMFAADSESDLIADVNAFRKCEAALRHGDRYTVETLSQDHFISTSTVKYMLKVARQVCDELHQAGLLPAPDPHESVFATIPPLLNKHSDCVPLLKALSMNLYNSDLALRKGSLLQRFRTSSGGRSLISHRGVNFLAKQEESVRRLRRPNDLLSYISRRQDTETPTTFWLGHTSMVTPLIAAIFCRSLHEGEQNDTVVLNEWIQMQVSAGHQAQALVPSIVAKTMVEFRKALERFCTMAFTYVDQAAALQYPQPPIPEAEMASDPWQQQQQQQQQQQTANNEEYKHPMMNTINQELRERFVDGVVRVLDADDQALRELFARNAMEAEQRQLQLEADRREREATKLRLQRLV